MDFSVIIPTYNRAPLLSAALASVFAQEHPAHEVIVVDDGSTDDTSTTLEKFGDRVTVLRQENRGPAAARNLGLTHARGEYVAFLDSDDLWFPWTLATYRRAIEANHRPAMVVGAHVDFEGSPRRRSRPRNIATHFFPITSRPPSTTSGSAPCGAAIRADALRASVGWSSAGSAVRSMRRILICGCGSAWNQVLCRCMRPPSSRIAAMPAAPLPRRRKPAAGFSL